MKKQHIILALGAMFMASCADEFDRNFEVGRPELSAEYAYLSDYKALKEYVADPNFKLGIGTDAADYAKQGPTYVITNVNFNETVAGNAMKMASCVGDDGNMNFGTVEAYVTEAAKAGMNVYGHTLAWHAQQPVKWLNSLLADKPIPVTPGGENPCIVFNNGDAGANQWDKQGIYSLPTPMVKGKTYIVKASVKTEDDYPDKIFGLWPIWDASPNKNQWGGSDDVQYLSSYATSKNFTDLQWEFEANFDHDKLQFVFGKVAGKVCIDNVSCKEKGSDEEMIVNGTFDANSTDGWAANWGGPSFAIEGQATAGGGTIKYMESVMVNGDLEGTGTSNFFTKEANGPTVNSSITAGVGKDGSKGIKITSPTGAAEEWDTQFWIAFPEALEEGTKFHVEFDYKANTTVSCGTQAHGDPGAYHHWECAGNVNFTTEWQHFSKDVVAKGDMVKDGGMKTIAFNLSKKDQASAYEYYFDNFVLEVEKEKSASGPVKYKENLISNSDMEGTDASNFISKEAPRTDTYNSTIVDGIGKDGSRGIQVVSPTGAGEEWDTQFWILLPEALQDGTAFHVEFDYKASTEVSCGTQAHGDPGAYHHWDCIGGVNFKTEWQHFSKDAVASGDMVKDGGMKSIAFNLAKKDQASANTYYFDNIIVEVEKESTGGGIPLTPQEKKDTLLYAMDKWIHGMMDACRDEEGNLLVKAWDVVNEPIGGNGQLQHGKADDKDNFFWQDYLGDLDYVRSAVKFARQYGGDDLKLFVNDYNLEYDWDASGNKKLESLISWINKWESDGVTKIDGIGSQMHISCYADATEAQKRKDLIVKSFQMMAETGKLVRISELDMGYVDANGNAVKTVEMTEEQHHQMADFYKWIIQQYKTIIPPAQQWGITLWCATDAPADSGWRPGEPVGIWDQNYYRKHVYAGIADGLSGE